MSQSESEMFLIHISKGATRAGLRKGSPESSMLRTGRKTASKVHVTWCQLPVTKRQLDLRIRNSYFGNVSTFILFVFLRHLFFVLPHYLVKFISKISPKLSGTKESSYIFVLGYTHEGWARSESRIPGERTQRHYYSLQEASLPERSLLKHGGLCVWFK